MAAITHVERDCWEFVGESSRQTRDKPRGEATRPRCEESLEAVVEDQVLPRLLQSWGAGVPQSPAQPADSTCEEHVEKFTDLILRPEQALPVETYFDTLLAEGYSVESLYLYLLTPAARRLGELWLDDRCGFAEVTLGTCRLHGLLHHSSHLCREQPAAALRALRVVLMPVAGEQHSLGLSMVGEFFRRAGWEVWSRPGWSSGQLADAVSGQWFEVAGLSAGCENSLETLEKDIKTIRKRSCNQRIAVMVGGPVFNAHPEWAAEVGADTTAGDGRQAVANARSVAPEPPVDR